MKYILFVLICIHLVGCASSDSKEPIPPMPEDFNFKLKYGVNSIQEIDTFNDRVVKDLVEYATVEASISLQKEEMESIYKQMMALDIMKIELQDDSSGNGELDAVSKWHIEMNGTTNSFYYNTLSGTSQLAIELFELEKTIHKMIEEKPEYKELPEASGGYE